MMKRHCDICDRVINQTIDGEDRYSIQKIGLEECWVNDICNDCFEAINRFIKEEMKHE